ncbi:SpoIIE family protein phosphatase [Beggiatoa leptomitoformis]|uniref:SpoIIE family protein phosphatase n=1 Tax=Beggiatoa leptomitoformis TaxID=288004 RepID=A0A2N9YCL1_9GAMM|nr:SpoIIE family protein phosphatase [Beggiatoa leptomitoformis]ALG66497.1 SpoIIE family protein phosphatase [Beggiatoa leptomitoformis]AUI68208.1 SpoIIE family protein phosphatase [Beggiatoa leptomitoformis]
MLNSKINQNDVINDKKYRFIIISILLFITIDVGVLIPNFILSSQIKEDALAINLAGRQRMLSQRMVKALLQLQVAQQIGIAAKSSLHELEKTVVLFDSTLSIFNNGLPPVVQPPVSVMQSLIADKARLALPVAELKKTVDLFDLTLNAFDKGNITKGGDGQTVHLSAVNTPVARNAVAQAITIWQPYRMKLEVILNTEQTINTEKLQIVVDYAIKNNLTLLDLMNQLTSELESIANKKAATIQLIQIIGIILVALNFIFLVFQVLRKLKRRDSALLNAHEHIKALNKTLTSENLRMSMELSIARQLQQILLPKTKELHTISHLDISDYMLPANEVGGDYYDILQCDGHVIISIGDVTGHGLESGIFTVMVQAAVRTLLVTQERNYTHFLESINKVIYENAQRMDSDRNLTFALLDYQYKNDGTGCLKITGQHENIILVQAGLVQLIDTIDLGFPIGLVDSVIEYVNTLKVILQPDDVVVLYTDGVTEAERINAGVREQYGIKRLCETIEQCWQASALTIRERIIMNVFDFIGKGEQFDDITLIVLKQREH